MTFLGRTILITLDLTVGQYFLSYGVSLPCLLALVSLEENVLPWGMLSEDMRKAFMDTRSLEYYGLSGGWLGFSEEVIEKEWWNGFTQNRIIRKRPTPLTKPDIPWDVLRDEFKWAARDENGNVWVHSSLPESGHTCWVSDSDYVACLDFLNAIDPGTCDWKDSLVERPK